MIAVAHNEAAEITSAYPVAGVLLCHDLDSE